VAVLRRETAGRAAAPKVVAVFADPVFESDDARLKQRPVSNGKAVTGASDVERSAVESGLDRLTRLYFSRQEAEKITGALRSGMDRLEALDFKANLATVRSENLGQYRILHFATHGLLNSQHPELSGLVFSLVTEQGEPQEGFLRLHEIYNLKLNAELVVLSACQTALGKEIKGEGLVGLTRGFMYAGSPRVMSSLWRIDDRATAELMGLVYESMIKKELRPAAALREAQSKLSRRWPSPYYWAAFTQQGEWK
jgi:CHAT domain-containing protein